MPGTDQERLEVWTRIFYTVNNAYRLFSADEEGQGFTAFIAAMRNYVARLTRTIQLREPAVWYTLGFNPELFYAFDVLGVCVQSLGVFYNVIQNCMPTIEFIDLAESNGLPADLCSADKCSIGAMTRGLYPVPTCHVGINTPCDSQIVANQAMPELAPAPSFMVDVPYYHDERSIKHVAAQLDELIKFMSLQLGRPMDWDRLRQACELANKSMENLWEWLEWRKHVPVVQPSKLSALASIVQFVFSGSEDGVMFTEGLLTEARYKAKRGRPVVNERARAIWYQDPVWWDIQLYDWMEKEIGLTIPTDVFGFYANEGFIDTSSREGMLYGLARKMIMSMPMSRQFRGEVDFFIKDFLHMYESFKADCGIYAGHIGCKHGWGGIGLLREACRKRGIPLLVFEFDMFDPRVTGQDDMKHELSRFVNEVVWPRKNG